MLTKGLPIPLNVSTVARVERVLEVSVLNPDGSERDVRYYTFEGVLKAPDGVETRFQVLNDAAVINRLNLYIPGLEYGTYEYAVVARSEDGDEESFMVGVLGVHWGGVPAEKLVVDTPNKHCVVRLPGDEDYSDAQWTGSSRIDSVLKSAEEVLRAAEEAATKLEKVEGVLAILDDKLHSVIIPNPETNTWWIGGIDTGAQVTGDPGKSPQISTDGKWLVWDLETQTWKDTGVVAVAKDGRSPYINGAGYWVEWDAYKNAWVQTPYKAAGKDGLDGTVVKRILVDSYDDIPQSGETCNGGYYYYVRRPDEEQFDIYAWLEQPDTSAGWVKVDMAYDIAKSDVYGLTKLGTDAVVELGSPVGTNAAGQMAVPVCDYTLPGSSRPSSDAQGGDGGKIFVDSDGRYWCTLAKSDSYGVVKYSTSDNLPSNNCIGLNAQGQLDVRRASLSQFGVVKAGSALAQLNAQPYQLAIGVTPTGELANNLLTQGALKHMRPSGWVATGMNWVAGVNLNGDSFYTGLETSDQFTQNSSDGLVLNSATATLKAGVFIATGLNDTRADAVFTAAQASSHFYHRGELYSKAEVDAKLAEHYTKAEADDKYLTETKADASFVQRGYGNPTHISYMSREQFTSGLTSVPKGHIIFVY